MTENNLTSDKRSWWAIKVTGYGTFAYYGTEIEAEDMRDHKTNWEGGHGTKRPATEDEIKEALKDLRWQKEQGYGLDEQQLEALND